MSIFDSILGQLGTPADIKNLAAKTGIDTGTLEQIVGHIGGEGALGRFATMIGDHPDALAKVVGFLDRDGDGNPLNDLAGLFGKR